MKYLVGVILVCWVIFGSPKKNFANWIWDDSPAPWETVDAYYYPDASDLTGHVQLTGLSSVEECRDWVAAEATMRGDPSLRNGDYECGIGKLDGYYSLNVYRRTVE